MNAKPSQVVHPIAKQDSTDESRVHLESVEGLRRLIEESARDPASGIGKPEPLSQNLSGYWSRRISDEHRLVYQVRGDDLVVVQARYHY